MPLPTQTREHRAAVCEAGSRDAERSIDELKAICKEKYGDDGSTFVAQSKWRQVRLLLKVTPKASRVAGFIILWALAMKGEGRDAYTISEFQRYYNENERKAYRDQAEFRELWPEFETPNELACQILPQLRGKLDATKLPSSVMVVAAT